MEEEIRELKAKIAELELKLAEKKFEEKQIAELKAELEKEIEFRLNKIARKIKAITKVTRAINRLNDGWIPDWSNIYENRYYIHYDFFVEGFCWYVDNGEKFNLTLPYIKTENIADQIIEDYEEELKIVFEVE